MERILNFEMKQENSLFVARCIELDILSDGETAAEAEANLREALDIYFADPGNRLQDD